MEFDFRRDLPLLERTPLVVRALLSSLPQEWTHCAYGQGTWSAHEVVGHLIFGEQTDWMPRIRIILKHGVSRPLDPFDRNGHAQLCRDRTLAELLDIFATLRAENLIELKSIGLTPADFSRKGMHPALGEVTLGQLLATWVVHDLNHIAQICKAMAYQHWKEVGPWETYMSILAPPAPR